MAVHLAAFGSLVVWCLYVSTAWSGEVHDAARAGDLPRLSVLPADNPQSAHACDSKGRTPLHLAAHFGSSGRSFEQYHVLHHSGKEVWLILTGRARSGLDVCVRLTSSDAAPLSDLLEPRSTPACGGAGLRYLDLLEMGLDALPAETMLVAEP